MIHIWNATTGAAVYSYRDHAGSGSQPAAPASPGTRQTTRDGAAASDEAPIAAGLASGTRTASGTKTVSASGNGDYVASGGADKTVSVTATGSAWAGG